MARNLDRFQTIAAALKDIPFPQGFKTHIIRYQIPVCFVESTASKILQPARVIDIRMCHDYADRKIRDTLNSLIYMTVRKSCIDQKRFLLSHDQELPHTSVIQNIKIFHK